MTQEHARQETVIHGLVGGIVIVQRRDANAAPMPCQMTIRRLELYYAANRNRAPEPTPTIDPSAPSAPSDADETRGRPRAQTTNKE